MQLQSLLRLGLYIGPWLKKKSFVLGELNMHDFLFCLNL